MSSYEHDLGKPIVVFAGEVASAIEQHPYKPRDETILRVWKRFDRFSFAFSVCLGYLDEVLCLVRKLVKNKPLRYPLPKSIENTEDRNVVVKILQEIFNDYQWRSERQKVMDFADTKEFREAQESELLQKLGEQDKIKEAMTVLCKEETQTVQEKVVEVCKKITKETGKEIDSKTQEALRSKLAKDRGTNLEAKTVVDFAVASGKAVKREPAMLYRKTMVYDGMSWLLVGRVDARDDHTIVEVKNRTRRFMTPAYDLLQLQSYMFLCEKKNGILLERLHGENRETPFDFNESYWDFVVVPALYEFVREVENKVIASRTILDDVTPIPSPVKRSLPSTGGLSSPSQDSSSDIEDKSPIKKAKRVLAGSSWDEPRSSDTELSSSQENSFSLYLSMSDTESDEELANLPIDQVFA